MLIFHYTHLYPEFCVFSWLSRYESALSASFLAYTNDINAPIDFATVLPHELSNATTHSLVNKHHCPHAHWTRMPDGEIVLPYSSSTLRISQNHGDIWWKVASTESFGVYTSVSEFYISEISYRLKTLSVDFSVYLMNCRKLLGHVYSNLYA